MTIKVNITCEGNQKLISKLLKTIADNIGSEIFEEHLHSGKEYEWEDLHVGIQGKAKIKTTISETTE